MSKKVCKICDKEIESEAHTGKVYIIQEDFGMTPFPTMYFHIHCYLLKHFFKVKIGGM